MANKEWCRHYTGVANDSHCEVGVEYQNVRDTSQVPHLYPCFAPQAATTCEQREDYTQEEINTYNREVNDMVAKMNALWSRESTECPNCGAEVKRMEQVVSSVYARPCGCRQGKGRVPEVWK